MYDYDSFIADVGGYLGLLLGQSMFGIYVWMTEWLGHNKHICKNYSNNIEMWQFAVWTKIVDVVATLCSCIKKYFTAERQVKSQISLVPIQIIYHLYDFANNDGG